MGKYVTAPEAVKVVLSNDRVYIHAAGATPNVLTKALTERASELRNVEICHLHTEGPAPYANPDLAESFHVNSFFIAKNVRHTLTAGNGSYTPVFLSELPRLFRKKVVPLDVVFIHVSPPDNHGYCSLGVSVEATVAAIESAKTVIAQVNPNMPRTLAHVKNMGRSLKFEKKNKWIFQYFLPFYLKDYYLILTSLNSKNWVICKQKKIVFISI